jgi:hypothetical protein
MVVKVIVYPGLFPDSLTALAASNLKDQPRTAALQRMRFWRAILPKREFPSLAQWIARFGRSYLRYRLKLSLPAIGQPDLDWRVWRRSTVRSDSDDRYGLPSPFEQLPLRLLLLAGYFISPTAKASS